jgi:antitoxin CcdA
MNAPERPQRRATDLHLEAELVDEARRLGVDLSRAAEDGLRHAVAAAKAWREENAEAIRQMNAWVAKHGLPLAKHRLF